MICCLRYDIRKSKLILFEHLRGKIKKKEKTYLINCVLICSLMPIFFRTSLKREQNSFYVSDGKVDNCADVVIK